MHKSNNQTLQSLFMTQHWAHIRSKLLEKQIFAAAVDKPFTDFWLSGEGHDDEDDNSQADEMFGIWFPWRTTEELKMDPLPLLWAQTEAPVWNAICLPSAGLSGSVWYSNKHLSKVHVLSHRAFGNWQKTQLLPCTKNREEERQFTFLFPPSVLALNIDFYVGLQGLIQLCTKMSTNNRPFKVLHSAKGLHNKWFRI